MPGPGRQDPTQRQPFPGQQDQQRFPEMQRTFFFSGKVLLDDGTPPPDSVVIERVCNGIARPEGYTDSKGRFQFQLGQNTAMMADASVGADTGFGGDFGRTNPGFGGPMGNQRGISERDLIGCELRASLAGFRSDVVSLAGRRALDNPDVGTIVLHRMAKVDGFTFSATTAYAPKDARKAYDKGREQARKKKFSDAEKELNKAVTAYPKFAAAWFELGMLYHQQNKLEEAKNAYNQSLAADAKFVNPYAPLARLAAQDKKWEEAADLTGKLIKLNPYLSADAYFVSAVANLNLNRADVAEEHTREALKMDKDHRNPRIIHLMAVILQNKQDYAGAAASLRDYLKYAPKAGDADQIRQQLAELEKRTGEAAGTAQAQ
jgi:tetratricopeptide (TPR) repeat protein